MATPTNPVDSDPELQPEIQATIFRELPDQFVRYDAQTYNPLDFYTSSGEFNLSLFNQTFREEQIKRILFYRKQEKERLAKLAEQPSPINLNELSIGQHLIRMKNTFFDITHEMTSNKPISPQLFIKNNRLFYIGLMLLMIFFVYLIFNFILNSTQ